MQGLVIKNEAVLTSSIITKEALKEGLLLIPAGEKVIRFVPPLTISKKEIDLLINKLNKTFSKII